jgi:hypothetical protein
MKKSLMAILTATVILVSSLGPLLYIQLGNAADSASWYKTVPGNLGSDTYSLYPFAAKNLTIGFSQFGELIDGNTKTGLLYDTTDPFAPDTTSPPEWQWIEGWILNVTYVQGGQYKNVWALATYSDYQDSDGIGGNWHEGVTVGSENLTVRGGRKTSGGAVTDPIKVLYDGPREFVGMTKTTIYDNAIHTTGLLTLTFYFDFNKVSKQVVIFKDVKRIDIGKNIGAMQIEFGDRGEWDLGAGTPPKSYAHFNMSQPTVYDGNWQPWYADATGVPAGYNSTYDVCQIIDSGMNYMGWAAFWPKPITSWVGATQEEADRPTIMNTITTITEDQHGTGSKTDFPIALGDPVIYPQNSSTGIHWIEDPMVFLDGSHRTVVDIISDPTRQVTYNRDTNTVTFPDGHAPALNAVVRIVYKVDKSKGDMSSEPNSPFVIGEWAFEMYEAPSQFRGVTVYGVGDIHNGNDAQAPDGANTLDRELTYQLAQVFNPWDLYQAVEKKTSRWVQYYNATTYDYVELSHRPVITVSDAEWDQYDMFSERVEDLNDSVLLHRVDDDPVAGETYDYTFTVSDGYATISDLPDDHYYKILYSTYNTLENWSSIDFDFAAEVNLTNGQFNHPFSYNYADSFTDILDATHELYIPSIGFTVDNLTTLTQDSTYKFNGTMDFYEEDFKVFKEGQTVIDCYWWDQSGPNGGRDFRHTADDGSIRVNFTDFRMQWIITPPPMLDLHMDWLHLDVDYMMTVFYNATRGNYTVTTQFSVNGIGGSNLLNAKGDWTNQLYVEHVPGRYEWGVVGRDAASVDSAGLSLVSAAFKNKQVEYGLAGEDMYDSNVANQMPWVMSKIGTATETLHTFNNYYYYNWPGYANDYRVALRDDWCTTWAGTSSNMIAVGGPLANMLSYYENDFTDAFYGLSQFTSDPVWANHIVAKTCWIPHDTAHAYTSTNTTGYGVITSYLDENGTAVMQIWGVWGRDTYYLTKWFHEEGIYELQEAPAGLTSIIVKISYKSYPEGYKPTAFNVVECLGTISETRWTGSLFGTPFIKGGIHDP